MNVEAIPEPVKQPKRLVQVAPDATGPADVRRKDSTSSETALLREIDDPMEAHISDPDLQVAVAVAAAAAAADDRSLNVEYDSDCHNSRLSHAR